MMKGKRALLIVLIFGVLASFGVYECKYYYSRWSDYRNSPWAYGSDDNAKLLVGQWKGSFLDPDKVEKCLNVEIFVPLTEEERKSKAAKHWKRASYSSRNKNAFHGLATVTSVLGTEQYEISGKVEKEDFHKLSFHIWPENEKKMILPNFTLQEATNGSWTGDELNIVLAFSFHKANGASFSSSDDPRYDHRAAVKLTRVASGNNGRSSN